MQTTALHIKSHQQLCNCNTHVSLAIPAGVRTVPGWHHIGGLLSGSGRGGKPLAGFVRHAGVLGFESVCVRVGLPVANRWLNLLGTHCVGI